MALILTRSPYHISRGTLDANASASVTIGRIDGGSVDVVEEYVLNFRDNLFIDISKLCSSVYTPSYAYVGVWNQYITNVVGEEVYRESKEQFIGQYTKQISLDNYGKGFYLLEINTSAGILNKKLILQ